MEHLQLGWNVGIGPSPSLYFLPSYLEHMGQVRSSRVQKISYSLTPFYLRTLTSASTDAWAMVVLTSLLALYASLPESFETCLAMSL